MQAHSALKDNPMGEMERNRRHGDRKQDHAWDSDCATLEACVIAYMDAECRVPPSAYGAPISVDCPLYFKLKQEPTWNHSCTGHMHLIAQVGRPRMRARMHACAQPFVVTASTGASAHSPTGAHWSHV